MNDCRCAKQQRREEPRWMATVAKPTTAKRRTTTREGRGDAVGGIEPPQRRWRLRIRERENERERGIDAESETGWGGVEATGAELRPAAAGIGRRREREKVGGENG